jgi:hypothetical protein
VKRPHLVWSDEAPAAALLPAAADPAPAGPASWADTAPATDPVTDPAPAAPPPAVSVPVPASTPSTGLPEVARKRGIQTFIEGLVIDVAVAIAVLILATVESITSTGALIAFGIALAKTIMLAAAAYVVRRYGDRSGVAFLYDVTRQRWQAR